MLKISILTVGLIGVLFTGCDLGETEEFKGACVTHDLGASGTSEIAKYYCLEDKDADYCSVESGNQQNFFNINASCKDVGYSNYCEKSDMQDSPSGIYFFSPRYVANSSCDVTVGPYGGANYRLCTKTTSTQLYTSCTPEIDCDSGYSYNAIYSSNASCTDAANDWLNANKTTASSSSTSTTNSNTGSGGGLLSCITYSNKVNDGGLLHCSWSKGSACDIQTNGICEVYND